MNIEEEFGAFLDILTKNIERINDSGELEHFGVKGMKWGVRKEKQSAPELRSLGPDKIVRRTKSGETITMSKDRPTALHKFIAKHSSSYRDSYGNSASFTLHNAKGERIGEACVTKRSKDELNLVWLGVDKSHRGKGYATACMETAAEFGRQEGFKRLTLEVPGNAPDARHIYTKIGFKVTKEASAEDAKTDPVWGGLTEMAYSINQTKHSFGGDFMNTTDQDVDDFLEHFGVKGMRWGHRKSRSSSGGESKKRKPTSEEIKDARIRVKSQEHLINNQIAKFNLQTAEGSGASKRTQDKTLKELDRMYIEYYKNPDRATAAKMTRGEKAALSILAVGVPVAGTAVSGLFVAAAKADQRAIKKDAQAMVDWEAKNKRKK